MDASIVINFGLLVLTGAASVAAIVQARIAQSAQRDSARERKQAELAAARASDAAEASAVAGERAAAALERQVALMEGEMSRTPSLEIVKEGNRLFRVRNASGKTLTTTQLESDLWRFGLTGPWVPPAELRPQQTFGIFLPDEANGATQTFTLSWTTPDGAPGTESFTIQSFFEVPRKR